MAGRADVQAAAAQVKSAELARKAATAEYYPSIDLSADYGAIGVNPSQSHGTFSVTGGVQFPIYRFGRIRADIDQADAALAQHRAEYEDLKARAEQDVRNAALDLTAAAQQVHVAESNRALAADTLVQSRDRFRAGVADTVEVVQAQESVASAEQDYISALYRSQPGPGQHGASNRPNRTGHPAPVPKEITMPDYAVHLRIGTGSGGTSRRGPPPARRAAALEDGAGSRPEKEEKTNPDQAERRGEKTSSASKVHHYRRRGSGGGCAAVLWWLHSRHFEDTDDAQVDGHISGIAARIAGNVAAVYVEENQFVKAGEVLVDLDPRDNKVAWNKPAASWLQAQAQTHAEQPNVPVTETTNQTNIATSSSEVAGAQAAVAAAERDYQAALAKIRESEANSAKAQSDVERYRPLAEKDEIPKEQFDQVVATAKALAATVAANQASAAQRASGKWTSGALS